MADIFISYARADRDKIETLAAALEAEGHSVWWDKRIQSGSEFSKDIEAELDAAKAVIVCWSANANESRWVKDEANAGAEAGKLLAVRLDSAMPPIGFRQFHCTDFADWKGDPASAAFTDFNQAVSARVTGAGAVQKASITNSKKTWTEKILKPVPLASLVFAIVAITATLLWPRGDVAPTTQNAQTLSAPPRIAVSSVNATGGGDMLNAMAQTLREDVASGLSRFSMIAVAAPGDENAAQYRLDSSLQQSGDMVRLTARLINTDNSKQVWGESWDRTITETSAFALQDDFTDHLVASVADANGALMRDLQTPVALKSPGEMTAYEAVIRNSVYVRRVSAEEHLISRTALRRAVELEPNNSDVWAALSGVSIDELKHDFNVEPGAADRALEQARRAVALDPDNGYAHFALAEAHFFRQELGQFLAARERTLELNPRDTRNVAMLGVMSGYAGDWDLGVALTKRAMALNPKHPGWYRFTQLFNEYRQGNYEAALKISNAINMPDYFAAPYTRAMILGQLGRKDEARAALKEFEALWTGDIETFKHVALERWIWAQPDLQAHVIDGLQKAGLGIEGNEATDATDAAPEKSIAVLPFADMSAAGDQEYFSDGLSEEILNVLAHINELKVAGRTSSFSFKGKTQDLREIGAALNVANILEGSIRKQGNRLRITAQLIKADDGYHLWSETYDRNLDDIFAIQDEIARAVADQLKIILLSDGGEILVPVSTTNAQAYALFVESQAHYVSADPRALDLLQKAIALDPKFARAYAALAVRYSVIAQNVSSDQANSIQRVENYARKALALDPAQTSAHAALGFIYFFQRRYSDMEAQFLKGVAIDPGDTRLLWLYGTTMVATGRHTEAAQLMARVEDVDPLWASPWVYSALMDWAAGLPDALPEYARRADLSEDSDKNFIHGLIAQSQGDIREMAKRSATGWQAYGIGFTLAETETMFLGAFGSDNDQARALEIIDRHLLDLPDGRNGLVPHFLLINGDIDRAVALFESKADPADEVFLSNLWGPYPEAVAFRQSEKFKAFVKRIGLLDYWKNYGWPDKCQPVEGDTDDFTCT